MTSTLAPVMDLPEPGTYADHQRNGLAAKDLFDGLIEHLFFLFGRTTEEIAQLRGHDRPWEWTAADPLLEEVFDLIGQGHCSKGDPDRFRPLTDQLQGSDPFFVLADFASYLQAQASVSATWGVTPSPVARAGEPVPT